MIKLLAQAKSHLEETRREVLQRHDAREDPFLTMSLWSRAIDQLIQELFQSVEEAANQLPAKDRCRTVLVSQGGYGRQELCYHSDIDLLLIYQGKPEAFVKQLSERLLQPLWDSGLEVGFAARTVKDCERYMEEDLTILTALMDSRYLTGDAMLYADFQKMMSRFFSNEKNRKSFYLLKEKERGERHEKYGSSVYLLEPNLKEGKGGLRDFHTLYWIQRVFDGISTLGSRSFRLHLPEKEAEQLWESLRFLWRIRQELHRRAGRRLDQLLFEYQEPLARWAGFEDTESFLGVEMFMQSYYRQAETVQKLTDRVMREVRQREPSLFAITSPVLDDPDFCIREGRLTVTDWHLFERDPTAFLRIFLSANRMGIEVEEGVLDQIEKNLSLVDENYRNNSLHGELFRKLLKGPVGLATVLSQMNDCGLLGTYLPEFGKLRLRVQHDIYHLYTVDVHSIFAVREFGRLLEGQYQKIYPTVSNAVRDIRSLGLLSLAILYHDIGKGEGHGHVEKGAPLIRQAGARLGFSAEEQDQLEFLERSHLIMTHLAFRRDLEDQNLIIQFAKACQNLDWLNMLYVQTFCDVKAVNQEALTDWKASLLEYLYLKTREVIQKGAYTPERVSTVVPLLKKRIEESCTTTEEKELCETFFSQMPPRYFLATPLETLKRHLQLWGRLGKEPILFGPVFLKKEQLNEVTLLTLHSPDLFSKIAGIFAAHHMNILSAELAVSRNGYALHLFRITDHRGAPIEEEEKWKGVEKDLHDLLTGKVSIDSIVAGQFKPSLFRKKTARILPTRIDIDNDVSAFYTVIDIYARDRIGLLYQITSTLAALGLYVEVSKISTKVDQVADTFYIKDIFGHKITHQERLEKMKEILFKVVDSEPAANGRPPL